ncbi:hypothetical protein AAFN85_28455 [Mucilaginibacter sp. CAU 1740]|uniref:hypothetical protein n=1 Tax=Mucilaginibacter sp. CAU 1740 TaxID=3140365 RepID=UPI00325B320C
MLAGTQQILHRFYDINTSSFKAAVSDLKPTRDYFNDGEQTTAYGTFKEMTLVYQFSYGLYLSVDGDLFRCNYDVCFAHPKEVIDKIQALHQTIYETSQTLQEYIAKYHKEPFTDVEDVPPPIQMTYNDYKKTLDTLNYVLESEEITSILQPTKLHKLQSELDDIKLILSWKNYINKLRLKAFLYIILVLIPVAVIALSDNSIKYISLLALFVPFIDSYFSKESIIEFIKLMFSEKLKLKSKEKMLKEIKEDNK